MYSPNMWGQMQAPNQMHNSEVIRVNGEEGAKAYQMMPNSSVLLLDVTQPVVWLKTTDGAGYPVIAGYSITPLEPKEEPKDNSEKLTALEERIARIERKLSNEQSNSTDAE